MCSVDELAICRGKFYTHHFAGETCMSSVLKKRRKKMRKHKYKKLRRRQKFERRKS
jgi:hypothetical protein